MGYTLILVIIWAFILSLIKTEMIIVKELPPSKSNGHCVISAVLTDMQ